MPFLSDTEAKLSLRFFVSSSEHMLYPQKGSGTLEVNFNTMQRTGKERKNCGTGFIFRKRPLGPIEIEMPILEKRREGDRPVVPHFPAGFLSEGRFFYSSPPLIPLPFPCAYSPSPHHKRGKKGRKGSGSGGGGLSAPGSCDNSREWTREKRAKEKGKKERMEISAALGSLFIFWAAVSSLPTWNRSSCGFCYPSP